MEKEVLHALLQRPVAFYPAVARVAGGVTAGLLLCQLLYWYGKGSLDKSGEGWIKKSWLEFRDETQLTQDEQRGARAKLKKAGLVKIERRGLDPTLWYLVDLKKLHAALVGISHQENEKSLQESGKTKPADSEKTIPIAESTPEISSITLSLTSAGLKEKSGEGKFEFKCDPTATQVILAVKWELAKSGKELGTGLVKKIEKAWAAGSAGAERRYRDLATWRAYTAAQMQAAAAEEARKKGRKKIGENHVGRELIGKILVTNSNVQIPIRKVGATIAGKFLPLGRIAEMLARGELRLVV